MNKKQGLKRWLWYFSLLAAVLLLYKVSASLPQIFTGIGKLINILSPFIGGFALAFLLYWPCAWLEGLLRRMQGRFWQRAARPLSLLIAYLVLFGVFGALVYLLIPNLVMSLKDLLVSMPQYIEQTKMRLEEFLQSGIFAEFASLTTDKWNDLYAYLINALQTFLTTENLLTALKTVVSATTSLVDVVVAVIVSVYMLADRERLLRESGLFLGLFFKKKALCTAQQYGRRAVDIFYKYLYGALLDALLVGVVVSIGLLVFRVPYAVLLGLLLGLMNLIPYFGAIIGGIGVVLCTLLTKNIYAAIGVAIYVVVIQQVDGNIIQPRIVGGSVGLRPIYVLLAITLFGGLFGFWGILLGVPLMAVLQMLVKDAIALRRLHTKPDSVTSPQDTP